MFTTGIGLGFFVTYLMFSSSLHTVRSRNGHRLVREHFIPQSPHSHGEMGDAIGPEDAQLWSDQHASSHHHHGRLVVSRPKTPFVCFVTRPLFHAFVPCVSHPVVAGPPVPQKKRQHRKIGKSKNGNSVFFHQRHTGTLSMSFNIFVVTCRVTNFLPKLMDMLLFSVEKTEFPFLVFPYFRVCQRNWPCSLDADKRPCSWKQGKG